MIEYKINSKLRIASFIANLLVESGCFKYTKELASGLAYEGRKDLGNINKGDGVKFVGRGLIQVTGRNNYQQLSKDFGVDFITHTELLQTPDYATKSACWFWNSKQLNLLADKEEFKLICERINGGLNGYSNRLNYYNELMKIL